MFNQKNLTCYWGDREELSEKQRKVIKDLGYKYRGKNQWLYFLSFEPGYYPYNLDKEEVGRMIQHMNHLERALQSYQKEDGTINFEEDNMFLVALGEEGELVSSGEAPLPFTAFQFGNLVITDEELLTDLKRVRKSKFVLEADL